MKLTALLLNEYDSIRKEKTPQHKNEIIQREIYLKKISFFNLIKSNKDVISIIGINDSRVVRGTNIKVIKIVSIIDDMMFIENNLFFII